MGTSAAVMLRGPADAETTPRLRDSFGRAITDLRLSVTDRCNYRCVYCRSGEEGVNFTELPIAEYLRMVRLFVSLGVEKIRLTGGEPLLRAGLVEMVRELAVMRRAYPPEGGLEEGGGGALDLALTTNGHLLEGMARDLKDAGLGRVTVSMDAVEGETFARITRVPRSFERVLAGVRAAQAAGLGPVKVNCVLLRGFNEEQVEGFAEFSRREGMIVRFIEFMPLEEPGSSADEGTKGTSFSRRWTPEAVVRMEEIVARLNRWSPGRGVPAGLVELPAHAASETARRFTFADGVGEIGIVAPVSRPFCGHCSRVRITSDGSIRTCLFSQADHDLVGRMRRGGTDAELCSYIRHVVMGKEARHHIGEAGFQKPSRNMVHIGG
ncbi:MAG: GTP 3',8-cyclase MoaA [Acidobacteriota bacterium]|nr:GTP 3',8-cyclase MoaA [Acidobacteriota bacterium]